MAAPWMERILDGKLGDAPFNIKSARGGGGARLQLTEFPLRDEPDIERLGKKTTEKSFDCFVVGLDYMEKRDALLAELDKQETQTLVHPYIGTLKVEIQSYTYDESTDEGGMARFSITWLPATSQKRPEIAIDTRHVTRTKSKTAFEKITGAFSETFSLDRVPAFLKSDAVLQVQKSFAAAQAAVQSVTGLTDQLGPVLRMIDSATVQLSSLISNPFGLAGSITGIISRIASTAANSTDALRQYRQLFSFGENDTDMRFVETPTRKRQRANRKAINVLVQQAAVVAAAQAVPDITFTTRAEAQAAQSEITDKIDSLLADAPDDVYVALMDVRAALVMDISARALNLVKLKSYSPRVTTPSLVIAYELYADATRADEIVQRNAINHPAFVSPFPALEVLAQ